MEEDVVDIAPRKKRIAPVIWGVAVTILLGPALLVWLVRATALVCGCAPGEEACHGMTLGAGLRDALDLAWTISTDALVLISLSIIATLAAFCERKPVTGTLSLVLLPLLSLTLPALAVASATHPDCRISPDGIGHCTLWGADMGRSFDTAATATDVIISLMPTCAALAVMMGLIGWFFAHPKRCKPKTKPTTEMPMRRFGEE